MKLVAEGHSGAHMPDDVRESYRAHSRTKYGLLIGRRYSPFAMVLLKGMGLKVLILDESGRPNWIPVALFAVEDGRLHASWQFGIPDLTNAPAVAAVWGYPELLANPDHFEQLVEREIRAWEAFADAASERTDLEPHELERIEVARELNRQYREKYT